MIKKSKEEEKLEKEMFELKKKNKKLEATVFELMKVRYTRLLREALQKIMRGVLDEKNYKEDKAVLDQLVETIFILFPCFEVERCGETRRGCFDWNIFRETIFKDEKLCDRHKRSKEKMRLLLKRQLPMEELAKIVFMIVILEAATDIFPQISCMELLKSY